MPMAQLPSPVCCSLMRSSAIPAPLDTMRDGTYGPLLAATTINAVRRKEGALAALLGLPLPAPTCPVTFTQAGWALQVPGSSCVASFGTLGWEFAPPTPCALLIGSQLRLPCRETADARMAASRLAAFWNSPTGPK